MYVNCCCGFFFVHTHKWVQTKSAKNIWLRFWVEKHLSNFEIFCDGLYVVVKVENNFGSLWVLVCDDGWSFDNMRKSVHKQLAQRKRPMIYYEQTSTDFSYISLYQVFGRVRHWSRFSVRYLPDKPKAFRNPSELKANNP